MISRYITWYIYAQLGSHFELRNSKFLEMSCDIFARYNKISPDVIRYLQSTLLVCGHQLTLFSSTNNTNSPAGMYPVISGYIWRRSVTRRDITWQTAFGFWFHLVGNPAACLKISRCITGHMIIYKDITERFCWLFRYLGINVWWILSLYLVVSCGRHCILLYLEVYYCITWYHRADLVALA